MVWGTVDRPQFTDRFLVLGGWMVVCGVWELCDAFLRGGDCGERRGRGADTAERADSRERSCIWDRVSYAPLQSSSSVPGTSRPFLPKRTLREGYLSPMTYLNEFQMSPCS